jgi:N-carbamoylputrescine amidase
MTRIAAVQFEPQFGEPDQNLNSSLRLLGEAANRGCEVAVLPELCISGYMFRDRQEAVALSSTLEESSACRSWARLAQDSGLTIVGGLTERSGGALYNSAVIVDASGIRGVYRKLHLWDRENVIFDRGDLGVPVFDTAVGRICALICYDGWFPETYRLGALAGADLVCIPTNWVPIPGQVAGMPAMATYLVMAMAHVNGLSAVAANRTGVERGQPFVGQSLIVNYTGWPVAGPASDSEPELLIADVDFAAGKASRQWNEFNHPLRDRRDDAYTLTTGLEQRA